MDQRRRGSLETRRHGSRLGAAFLAMTIALTASAALAQPAVEAPKGTVAPVPLEQPGAEPPARRSDLYHGNYCGTGDAGPGRPPIDELDAVCMRHDQCYDEARRRSCACDRTLMRDALAIANGNSFSRDLRAKAATVLEAAQLMACSEP